MNASKLAKQFVSIRSASASTRRSASLRKTNVTRLLGSREGCRRYASTTVAKDTSENLSSSQNMVVNQRSYSTRLDKIIRDTIKARQKSLL